MKAWKSAALAAALFAAAGLGAAFTPAVHGQTATRPRTPARAYQVLTGHGGQIGVTIRDVDDDEVKSGKASAGVVIDEVSEDSPAEKAGMKTGDIVVEFDGERVRSVRQFTRLVQETPAGRKVQASVMRGGQKMNMTVETREDDGFRFFGDNGSSMRLLEDLGRNFRFEPARPVPAPPAPPAAPAPPTPFPPDIQSYIWRSGNSLGMSVSQLSTQLAEYFGTRDGVLVTSVASDSAAAKAGVKAGDVITSINGTNVEDPADLRSATQRMRDGDEFTIGVMRDKKSLTLKGKMENQRSRRTFRSIV